MRPVMKRAWTLTIAGLVMVADALCAVYRIATGRASLHLLDPDGQTRATLDMRRTPPAGPRPLWREILR